MSRTEQFIVTLAEAAQRLGWSWRKTFDAILRRHLSAERRGGRWFVSKESLTEMLTQEELARRATVTDSEGGGRAGDVRPGAGRGGGMSTRGDGRSPALAAWRGELAGGWRTVTDFDELWRAAAAEQLALEHEADGLPEIAEKYRAEALGIIARAAERGAA